MDTVIVYEVNKERKIKIFNELRLTFIVNNSTVSLQHQILRIGK